MSDDTIMACFIGGVVAICAVLMVLAIAGSIQAANDCDAAGGTMRSISGMGLGVSSTGQAVPAVTITTVCVSADGRIL